MKRSHLSFTYQSRTPRAWTICARFYSRRPNSSLVKLVWSLPFWIGASVSATASSEARLHAHHIACFTLSSPPLLHLKPDFMRTTPHVLPSLTICFIWSLPSGLPSYLNRLCCLLQFASFKAHLHAGRCMVFPPVCRSYKRPAYIHAVHRMCPMATTHGSS